MRHKLPCELLTYACLHMISYSQNRLRFEALTAVVSTSVNHTDQLIHPRNLFLFFNSCKLLPIRAESMWGMGHVGTERSLLCNEAQTSQMKEHRAATDSSHPDEAVVFYSFHQVS